MPWRWKINSKFDSQFNVKRRCSELKFIFKASYLLDSCALRKKQQYGLISHKSSSRNCQDNQKPRKECRGEQDLIVCETPSGGASQRIREG
jgi:hypothetical protein